MSPAIDSSMHATIEHIQRIIHRVDQFLPRGTPVSWVGRILLFPIDLYLGLMVAYFALRAVSGWVLWPVALISDFLHFLLIPAMVVLVIMLLLRRWRRAMFAGLLAVMWMILFGSLFLPDRAATQRCEAPVQDGNEIIVMTYNVGYGLAVPDALASVLRESGADIVGLQEVSLDQGTTLKAELSELYPYQSFFGLEGNGLGLLSRFTILNIEYVRSRSEHEPAYIHGTIAREPDRPSNVFVLRAHPPRLGEYPVRNPWTDKVRDQWGYHTWRGPDGVAAIAVAHSPAILLVDMNTTDQSRQAAAVRRLGFQDVYRAAGQGFGLTFPGRANGWRNLPSFPFTRIDMIWSHGDFTVCDSWIGSDAGSDHLPVIARLRLTDSSE